MSDPLLRELDHYVVLEPAGEERILTAAETLSWLADQLTALEQVPADLAALATPQEQAQGDLTVAVLEADRGFGGGGRLLENRWQGRQHLLGHLGRVFAPLLHLQVGLAVERLPLGQEFAQAGAGIVGLEQGPGGGIGLEPLQQQRCRRIQPHHHALAHVSPVFRPCHHPAAGGHHQGMPAGDLAQHRRFQLPKPNLSVAGEDVWDGAARHLLEGVVGVEEAVAQRFG
jgi:hypothetical protein